MKGPVHDLVLVIVLLFLGLLLAYGVRVEGWWAMERLAVVEVR